MALNSLKKDQAIARFDEERGYFTEQVSLLDLKIRHSAGSPCQLNAPEEAVQAEWKALESAGDDDCKKKR